MQAKWTPAEDGGPARFSQRYRNEMGDTAYQQWTIPDEVPQLLAGLRENRTLLAAAAAVALSVLLYVIRYQWRVLRAWYAARQLLAGEEADAKAVALEGATVSRPSKPADAAKGPTVTRRVCRLCDVVVEDAYVGAHLSGKKHKRLASTLKVLTEDGLVEAHTISCWVFREFLDQVEAPAPVQEELLAPVISRGRGMGQWEEVGGKGNKATGGKRAAKTKHA